MLRFDFRFEMFHDLGGNWDSTDSMLLWVHTVLEQATHRSAMLTLRRSSLLVKQKMNF